MDPAGLIGQSTPATEHALPTGDVAFLFTDIEGSTVRWDRDADAMRGAVRRHDGLMRQVIAAHDGHVFKTIGDAFCAVFWCIDDGVAAALDAQRALGQEDFSAVDGIKVRMALHVGMSDEREGDYFGPTLNRVARLLSIGYGGQVLLSSAAAKRLTSDAGLYDLLDLGEHRLKDLTAPEHVLQLAAAGLALEFPKLKSLSVLDNNLPLQLTALVGREQDLAQLKTLLENSRLVTLTGAGGVGKTRCAIQLGADILERFADGAWFVDLAPLGDGGFIPNVIASIFNIHEVAQQPMLDSLVGYFKNRQLLLIIDNCEHVVREAATVVDTLLRACPKLSVVATSREGLGLHGEAVYRMPSLTVPERRRRMHADEALSYGAIALFDVRARAANTSFAITDDNAAIVADICRRLDGIPLAIELAAARVKILNVASLAQRLDDRFRLLTGGSRTALPRQQTMRALIDWSYDLLPEKEKRLFRYFSIFSGSFGLGLASVVCADESIDDLEVVDLLASLVDKSLVTADHSEAQERYRLLESTRQYAREKLADCKELEVLAYRHAAAYAALAEELGEAWDHTPDVEWLAQAEPEMDNWRAAISWAGGPSGDRLLMQRLARATAWLELARAEGRKYVRQAREAATAETPRVLVAQLELAASKNDSVFGQFKAALASAERALAIFEELGDELGVAQARLCTGRALLFLGRIEDGESALRAAHETFRTHHARKASGSALSALGTALIMKDDIAGARLLLKEAAGLYEVTGAQGRLPAVLSLLAEAEFRTGDAGAALTVATKGLDACRALKTGPGNLLLNSAAYLTALGRYDEARSTAHAALEAADDEQSDADVDFAIQHLVAATALSDAANDETRAIAAQVLGFVDAHLEQLDASREFTEQREYETLLSALESSLGEKALRDHIATGRRWDKDRAIAELLALT